MEMDELETCGGDALLKCMAKAARLAGLKIREALVASGGRTFKIKTNSADLVTETDIMCQELIVGTLKQEFPEYKIVGEESAEGADYALTMERTFIIDPIDGTSNFAKGIPHCAVLISCAINGRIDRAVILDPSRQEMFWAIAGKGAFLSSLDAENLTIINGKDVKLRVNSDVKTLREATVFTDCGYTRDTKGVARFLELQNQLLSISMCRALRVQGSCGLGLAWVASGRADVYVEREGPLIWDFSGGDLLVREAGGISLDPTGIPFEITKRSVLVAANRELAGEVVACVKRTDAEILKRFA